mgnify:CR=1 FL=1
MTRPHAPGAKTAKGSCMSTYKTSALFSHAPTPGALPARLIPGYPPGHCPRPLPEAGEEREAQAGWGVSERNFWVTFCPGRGFPPPRSPPPVAIATTVHCTGRSRGRTRYGFPPDIPTRGGGTKGSAPWGMGRRPDVVCSFGIDALVDGDNEQPRARPGAAHAVVRRRARLQSRRRTAT